MWSILSEMRGKKSGAPIPMKDLHVHFNSLLNNPPKNVLANKLIFIETKVKEYLNNKSCVDVLSVGGYSTDCIMKTVKTLKNGKSAFIDGAINEVLKHSIYEMSPIFAKIFNHIEKSTFFPSAWKSSFLVPLHKKGSQGDPDNYRGLAVGSNIGKLYTKCLNAKIKNFAEEQQILSPHQFGFREDFRTTDAMFSLRSMTSYYKTKNKPVYACFVDFSKAFDSINRAALIYKLGSVGIKGEMLKLIYNMYSCSSYVIKSDGKFSIPVNSTVGVKQGCNLSPLLFNIFINDVHNIFGDCKPLNMKDWKVSSLSFADDIVLLSETEKGLNDCLEKLESYCNEWGLKVNPLKTKVILFNKKFTKTVKNMKFSIDGNPIEVTNSYCYLGVEISNTGSFVKATDILYKKALKSLFSIYSSLNVRSDEKNIRLFLKLFDSLIKPVLLYGSDIWGSAATNPKNSINKFVHKFYKTLLGVPPNTSIAGLHAELGRFPIHVNIQQTMLKYWFRIVTLPTDRLAAHCYWSLLDLNPLNDQWLNTIQSIISSCGQYFIWNSQKTLYAWNPRSLLRHETYLCRTLQDISMQQTSEKINGETKLSFFKNCKTLNKISNYLNTLHGRSQRSNLSRLRLGTLDLEIEKGRWRNIPREERLCKICKTLEVENVEHFVLFCPALCQCRNLFMNNITSMNSNFASMSPENKIKYLFFNETLPHNILVLSANLLVALTETRRSLLNLKENIIIHNV